MAEFDTVIRNAAIATAADIFETIANMSILRRRPDSDRPAMRSRQNLSADHRGDATKLNLCRVDQGRAASGLLRVRAGASFDFSPSLTDAHRGPAAKEEETAQRTR